MPQLARSKVHKPKNEHFEVYYAMRCVFRDIHQSTYTLDTDLLFILAKAPEGITFSVMYRIFNSAGPSYSNFTYYAALNRLTAQGYASVAYLKRGRVWSITPQGLEQIARCNAAADKYLNKKTG